MQGTHTGGPFGIYSMAQSKILYSALKINGNFTEKGTSVRVQDSEETVLKY